MGMQSCTRDCCRGALHFCLPTPLTTTHTCNTRSHAQLYYLPGVAMLAAYIGIRFFLGAGAQAGPMVAGGVSLVASALCICAIGCLSHQSTARTGACGVLFPSRCMCGHVCCKPLSPSPCLWCPTFWLFLRANCPHMPGLAHSKMRHIPMTHLQVPPWVWSVWWVALVPRWPAWALS